MGLGESGGYADAHIAQFYDCVPGYAARRDIDFYVDEARKSGGPVLELGCGTGRVLLPIARAGIDITGLDLAEPMLAVLRAKLERESQQVQERVELVHADARRFELGREVALVVIPFRVFQHVVSADEQLACLDCVKRHLRGGASLVLDLFQTNPQRMHDPAYTKESEDFAGVELPDGGELRRTHRVVAFHRAEQYNDMEMLCEAHDYVE